MKIKRPSRRTTSVLSLTETLGPNGEVPESRVPNADTAWRIADQLRRDDEQRASKRIRVYKAYKRFPPTAYSTIVKRGAPWMSNVCWGQLAFIIDSQKSAYYDMISEAPQLVDISTKFGEDQRMEYSEKISFAWDYILRKWDKYMPQNEQLIEETLLNAKGIQIWPSVEGWESESISNNEILFKDKARLDLRNVDEIVVRWSYSPVELWDIIKDRKTAEEMGWNVDACIDMIRFGLKLGESNETREDWVKRIAEGSINLSSIVNEEIRVYWVHVREYDQSITKFIIPRDYTPIFDILSSTIKASAEDSAEIIRNKIGFMFAKQKCYDNWNEFINIGTDSAGSGKLHEAQSQADQLFVGCRQYDMTMNRIIDAIYINMMLMLSGGNPDANKILREMDFLPVFITPDGVTVNQQKLNIPTTEALQALTYQMRDLYSGASVYKANQATNGGRQRTRGEAELDAAEMSQVRGSQLSRFNQGRTAYLSKLYKKFVNTKKGEQGYELVEEFFDMLKELGVPKEAAAWKNIRYVRSKMLSGAGSMSMKIIAAEKTIGFAGMVAANEGQEKAIRQAIAALQGAGNVDDFRPKTSNPLKDSTRIIALENAAMSVPNANPENFKVFPSDKHMEHITGHYSDMMVDTSVLTQMFDAQADPEDMQDIIERIKLKGGHSFAHLNFIAQDQTKKETVESIAQNFEQLQQVVDQIAPQVLKALEAKAQQQGQQVDPELERKMAMAAIDIDLAKKLADIKVGERALSHEQKRDIELERAATDIAIKREKAVADKPTRTVKRKSQSNEQV